MGHPASVVRTGPGVRGEERLVRLRSVRLGLLLVVAVAFPATKEPAEKALFLLLLLLGRWRRSPRLSRCRRCLLPSRRRQRRHTRCWSSGSNGGLFADAKDFLEEIA